MFKNLAIALAVAVPLAIVTVPAQAKKGGAHPPKAAKVPHKKAPKAPKAPKGAK